MFHSSINAFNVIFTRSEPCIESTQLDTFAIPLDIKARLAIGAPNNPFASLPESNFKNTQNSLLLEFRLLE